MVNPFFPAGTTVRSDLSFLNLENFCTLSTMPTITESHLFQEHLIAKRLSLVVWKVKSESGESEGRLRSWKAHSKNTEVEFPISKLTKLIPKLSHLHTMGHASSGISLPTPELCVSLSQLCSSKFFIILMRVKFLLLVATERSLTGTALMDKPLECSMDLRPERLMLLQSLKTENTSLLVDKTRELNFGITMRESNTTTELAILETLPRFKSHRTKELLCL